MRMTFLNDPEDVAWLRSTHLTPDNLVPDAAVPPFHSFTLEGNEDSPEKLTLYADADPNLDDRPVGVYQRTEDGRYELGAA